MSWNCLIDVKEAVSIDWDGHFEGKRALGEIWVKFGEKWADSGNIAKDRDINDQIRSNSELSSYLLEVLMGWCSYTSGKWNHSFEFLFNYRVLVWRMTALETNKRHNAQNRV